jgi:hypothetical protein
MRPHLSHEQSGWDRPPGALAGVMNKDHSHLDKLTLFKAADDELFPGVAGKFFFSVVTILVLDQKIVIPEKGINFLWEKLPHLKREHFFVAAPFVPKKPVDMINL